MRGVFAALSIAACAATSVASAQEIAPAPQATPEAPVGDPWEAFNRDMFAVHESVDQAVVEPIARGYRAITPSPFRAGVRNILRNLRSPVIFTNDVLQAEGGRAATTAARFVVNSTVGVLGVFDVASTMGLERHEEDFGQTLAVWGVDSGPYIFVPLLGPTTLRDGAGRLVDIAFDPLTWAEFDEVDTVRTSRTVFSALAARESVLDAVDDIRRDSLDPYVTIRTSYGFLRESAIQNGRTDVQDLPEFDDTFDTSGTVSSGENTQHFVSTVAGVTGVILATQDTAPTSAGQIGDK